MKIVGGILPYKDRAKMIEQSGTVTWSWFNIASGTVKWTLENNYNVTKSFVLFRNSYYFGNAFWPVYLHNSDFNVKFLSGPEVLKDEGTSKNSAPIAVVDLNDKPIICFVFTLSPGQHIQIIIPEIYDVNKVEGMRFFSIIPVTRNSNNSEMLRMNQAVQK